MSVNFIVILKIYFFRFFSITGYLFYIHTVFCNKKVFPKNSERREVRK